MKQQQKFFYIALGIFISLLIYQHYEQQDKKKIQQDFDFGEEVQDEDEPQPSINLKQLKAKYKLKSQVSKIFFQISLLKSPYYDSFIASTSKKQSKKQKMDLEFCYKSDTIKLANPNFVDQLSFVTDQRNTDNLSILQQYGKLHPKVQNSTNMYFTISPSFHTHFEVNHQILCQFQIYNHIPGLVNLFDRDLRALRLREFYQKTENKNLKPIQERTFRLHDEEECQSFFNLVNQKYFNLNNDKSKQNTTFNFILSENRQQQKNVYLNQEILENLEQISKNCGVYSKQNNDNNQEYEILLDNPLRIVKQIQNTKESLVLQKIQLENYLLRYHVLVASTNPFIVYLHDNFDVLVCSNTLFQDCLKVEVDINQILSKQQLEQIQQQVKNLVNPLIESVKGHTWQDSRVFEFLSLDVQVFSDNSVLLQSVEPVRKLYASEGYEKILDDGIDIMYQIYKERMGNLISFGSQIESHLKEFSISMNDNDIFQDYIEGYLEESKNKPANMDNLDNNLFRLVYQSD